MAIRKREWCWIRVAPVAMLAAMPGFAQVPPAGPSPLVVQPQGGATPALPPAPAATIAPAPQPGKPRPAAAPLPPLLPTRALAPLPPSMPLRPSADRSLTAMLPAAGEDPVAIDPAGDPLLAFARARSAMPDLRGAVAATIARHPLVAEAVAGADEAKAARNEAIARQMPTIDLSLSYFNIVTRQFANDPLNILERSRPRERTDGIASVQQPLIDFGANRARVRAAAARLDAAIAGIEDTRMQLALRAVGGWSAVFVQRAALAMVQAAIADQRMLGRALDQRVEQGYAAPADRAQIDGYIAAGEAQVADLRRGLASSEAQYAELAGVPPPPGLARLPMPDAPQASAGAARVLAEGLPAVRAARSLAVAATRDASMVRAGNLPQLGLGVTAGRYGVLETARDYDVRASATLSWRLFGGAKQREDQAAARARGADARLARTLEEARRDAAIAAADVAALAEAERALADDYLAARRARDAVVGRFRVSRGSLFDVAVANGNLMAVAARYLQTIGELDVARYTLLARTDRLFPAIAIDPKAAP